MWWLGVLVHNNTHTRTQTQRPTTTPDFVRSFAQRLVFEDSEIIVKFLVRVSGMMTHSLNSSGWLNQSINNERLRCVALSILIYPCQASLIDFWKVAWNLGLQGQSKKALDTALGGGSRSDAATKTPRRANEWRRAERRKPRGRARARRRGCLAVRRNAKLARIADAGLEVLEEQRDQEVRGLRREDDRAWNQCDGEAHLQSRVKIG